jgi:AbrB family looped-hinge helix DNA binding protein
MNATVIREKRQTTLPAEVCETAGLKPGDQVEWRFEDGEIRGRKLKPVEPLVIGVKDVPRGSILPKGWKASPLDIARAIREERDAA